MSICPKCDQEIQPDEEVRPVVNPYHVQCPLHDQCYPKCLNERGPQNDEHIVELAMFAGPTSLIGQPCFCSMANHLDTCAWKPAMDAFYRVVQRKKELARVLDNLGVKVNEGGSM